MVLSNEIMFITWEYDALDRVVTQTEQPDTSEEKCTRYTYDPREGSYSLQNQMALVLTHTYDALGRLTSLSPQTIPSPIAYTYDLCNNPIVIDDAISGFSYKTLV